MMHLSIYGRLNLGEVKPTKMYLQLTDRFINYPIGIPDDIPIRIGQRYIPIDFVVMDIEEDAHILILLERSIFPTTGAIIDVKKGKLTFDVGDEKIEFMQSKFMKNIHWRFLLPS